MGRGMLCCTGYDLAHASLRVFLGSRMAWCGEEAKTKVTFHTLFVLYMILYKLWLLVMNEWSTRVNPRE